MPGCGAETRRRPGPGGAEVPGQGGPGDGPQRRQNGQTGRAALGPENDEAMGKTIGTWWLNGGLMVDLMGFDGMRPSGNDVHSLRT